jgi:hypothetical protein
MSVRTIPTRECEGHSHVVQGRTVKRTLSEPGIVRLGTT